MQYETNDGESIFDIALKTVGSLEKTYSFILSNPQITNIDFSFDNKLVATKYIPSDSISPKDILGNTTTAVTTGKITGREGQSVFDICLMSTGDIGSIAQFLLNNGISSVDEDDLLQKVFTFKLDSVKDNLFYNSIVSKKTIFNTGIIKVAKKRTFNQSFNQSFS